VLQCISRHVFPVQQLTDETIAEAWERP
jgi:hypothetical protein